MTTNSDKKIIFEIAKKMYSELAKIMEKHCRQINKSDLSGPEWFTQLCRVVAYLLAGVVSGLEPAEQEQIINAVVKKTMDIVKTGETVERTEF